MEIMMKLNMKDIDKANYRIIQIDDIAIIDTEKSAITELSGKFDTNDIIIEAEDDSIRIYLKMLDYKRFNAECQNIIIKHKLKQDNLIHKISDKIDSIRSYGLKSGKRVYFEYNKERKVQNRKDKEKERGMYFYAVDHKFSKTNNVCPVKFINQIITGDSEEVLKKLPDNCVDLVFTSPPYNFGLDYDSHIDGTDWDGYFDKLFGIFAECIRVTKYGGRIIVNVQPLFSDYIPIHHIISDFFMKNKLIWKGEILWDKHNWNCKYTAWGSWKSPSNPYLKNTWEFLEIFCKGNLKKEGRKEDIDITVDEFKKLVIAKWDIAPERRMKEYGHPAMFPETLVYSVLKLFSYRGDVILDPFNGVGTTSAVSKKLGRKYIGIDISDKYNKIAEKRLNGI
jgi:DNA modification methylase